MAPRSVGQRRAALQSPAPTFPMNWPASANCFSRGCDPAPRDMKIGLLGGSFDPVHLGASVGGAGGARRSSAWTRSVFIPAAQSPFKPGTSPAPAPERLRLLRLALAGETACDMDDLEIRRGGVSYTVDTLRHYAEKFPGAELFYLIGADQTAQLTAVARSGGTGPPGAIYRRAAPGRKPGRPSRAVSRAEPCAGFRWRCRPPRSGRGSRRGCRSRA